MNIDLIILVDDNPVTIFYNKDVVEDLFPGIEILSYESSKEFIDDYLAGMCSDGKNTLLLLDVNMPEYCGFETLSELEDECEELDNLTVLMLTSSSLKVDKEKATRFVSVKGYIEKPLTEAKLGSIINIPLSK